MVSRPNFSKVLGNLISDIGLRDELRKECKSPTELGHRWENAQEVINAVGNFEAAKGKGVKDYLDSVVLYNDMDNDKQSLLEHSDTVKLITLHGAKGLEFPHAYIVGLEEDILPHLRSTEEDNTVQEERRLFYVGITRAMLTLTISHAQTRRKYGKLHYRTPSRFLEELPDDLISHDDSDEPLSEEEEKILAKEYLSRIKDIFK